MMSFAKIPREFFLVLLVMVCAAGLVFSVNGMFDTRIDAPIYAAQISSFAAGNVFSTDPTVIMRLFKPLYGIIGGWLFHSGHPYGTILSLNIFFYMVLAVSAYFILKGLEFSKQESMIGTLWVVTAYPLLKYGLALGTDMSGWALAALTVGVGLMAIKKDSNFLLALASIVGFLGAITKETGPLGLGAIGLLVIWHYRKQGIKICTARLASVCVPFVILYGILLMTIAGHAPNLLDWLQANRTEYGGTHSYSLLKLIAVEGSTFGLYWLGVIYVVIAMMRNRESVKNRNIDYVVAAFVATLPILIWPLFISRILFIQFLWVIPLALYGYKIVAEKIQAKYPQKGKVVVFIIIVVPIVFGAALFLIGSQGSLFNLFTH